MQHTLTTAQADLFCKLAQYEQEERLFLPIRPLPSSSGASDYVIYLRGSGGNFRFSNFGDIDALCAIGFMEYSLTRMGDGKKYTITKLGRQLFKQGMVSAEKKFERLDLLHQATSNLKNVLGNLMAGEALSRAIIEIQFVQSQAQSGAPNHSRIQTAMQRVQGMINSRFTYVTLPEAAAAASAFGRWCQDVLFILERKAQPIVTE